MSFELHTQTHPYMFPTTYRASITMLDPVQNVMQLLIVCKSIVDEHLNQIRWVCLNATLNVAVEQIFTIKAEMNTTHWRPLDVYIWIFSMHFFNLLFASIIGTPIVQLTRYNFFHISDSIFTLQFQVFLPTLPCITFLLHIKLKLEDSIEKVVVHNLFCHFHCDNRKKMVQCALCTVCAWEMQYYNFNNNGIYSVFVCNCAWFSL